MNDKQKKLIEKIGIFQEQAGMQPIAARVIGLLLVSKEPELTFDEIREHLNISKSAASNAINLLLRLGQLEYITRPGERKRYFRDRLDKWKEVMKQNLDNMLSFKSLLIEVKELKNDANKEFVHKLDEMISFMEFMHQEIPVIMDKWEQRDKKEKR